MDKVVKKNSIVMIMIKGLMVSYILTGILMLLLAMLLFKMDLNESKVTIGIIAIYIVTCFLGGFITGKKAGTRKFIWGLILGAAYFIILTLVSFAVNRTLQSEPMHFMTTLMICTGAGMLGGMVS